VKWSENDDQKGHNKFKIFVGCEMEHEIFEQLIIKTSLFVNNSMYLISLSKRVRNLFYLQDKGLKKGYDDKVLSIFLFFVLIFCFPVYLIRFCIIFVGLFGTSWPFQWFNVVLVIFIFPFVYHHFHDTLVGMNFKFFLKVLFAGPLMILEQVRIIFESWESDDIKIDEESLSIAKHMSFKIPTIMLIEMFIIRMSFYYLYGTNDYSYSQSLILNWSCRTPLRIYYSSFYTKMHEVMLKIML